MKEVILIDFAETVTVGVLIFVLGQIISKFFLDSVCELRKSIGEAKFVIIFRANYYCNPGDGKEKMEPMTNLTKNKIKHL